MTEICNIIYIVLMQSKLHKHHLLGHYFSCNGTPPCGIHVTTAIFFQPEQKLDQSFCY